MEKLPIKLSPGATMPKKAHETDAGYDLYATEEKRIESGWTVSIKTGVFIHMPPNIFASIRGRSLLNRRGILCHVGTIDPGYTGEIKIILTNLNGVDEAKYIDPGERIAQLIFEHVAFPEFELSESLPKTERGQAGFGSTGQ